MEYRSLLVVLRVKVGIVATILRLLRLIVWWLTLGRRLLELLPLSVTTGHSWLHRIHLLVYRLLALVHLLLLIASAHWVLHTTHWVHILGWLLLDFERIVNLIVVQHVEYDFHIVFPNVFLLNNILNLESIDTHILSFSNQLLLKHRLVIVKLLLWVYFLTQAKLCSYLFSFFFFCRVWLNVALLKEVGKLERNFLQCLFG